MIVTEGGVMDELLLTLDMEVEAVFGIGRALERRRRNRPYLQIAALKGAETRRHNNMTAIRRSGKGPRSDNAKHGPHHGQEGTYNGSV